ncbi:MAG: multidrug ABC transporter permease [Acidobacteria bacterium]|nr:MAG: multidrug ABC transporter permease [Acidobacteriota bacterium]PYQ24112.1 MAG: multidrug ABC transporter permease [Acidobacteriota bacterium]
MPLPISYNVRNVRTRWQVSLLAVIGIGLVVTVFVALMAMRTGFTLALRATGEPGNAMVVQRGSASELTSWVPLDHRNKIVVDQRVAVGSNGRPLASPEIVVVGAMPRRSDHLPTNVTIRGVTPSAFEVRGGIEIKEGRTFQPGLDEVIVGKRIADRIQGLDLGATIPIQRHNWKIVGIFTSRGGAFESEIWGDLDTMAGPFRRQGGSNSLAVRLKDASTLESFDRWIRDDPEMQLQAVQERKYYEDQAGGLSATLLFLVGFVSLTMGVGAVFGAMNTMYAIVAARTREIGTLRALGFSRRSILFSFVMESVILALAGGLFGCLLAFPINGFSTASGQTPSFSEVAFAFQITPDILARGLVFATAMGFFGGLLPALRGAKLPITSALREA